MAGGGGLGPGLPAGTGRDSDPRLLGRRLSLSLFAGESRDLDWHLRHCTQGVLFAVTLGAETDRLLRRWSVQSMAKAAVGQAVCAVWLDDLCAAYCAGLLPQLGAGEFLTPPFSPGYGDWSLAAQDRVLDLLQAPKRIGLTLTEGGMLVPENPSPPWWASVTGRRRPAAKNVCDAIKQIVPSGPHRRERKKGALSYETTAPGDEGAPPLSGRRHGKYAPGGGTAGRAASRCVGMENPQAVQGVHRAYLEAGCRLITTNTFGTSAPKLAPMG